MAGNGEGRQDDTVMCEAELWGITDSYQPQEAASLYTDHPAGDVSLHLYSNKLQPVHLPQELWVRIFRYLDPVYDQLPMLGMVCWLWRLILRQSPILWKHIHINPSYYTYTHFSLLMTILRQYGHHIQIITWKDNATVYEPIFDLICRLDDLRSLKLPILWNRAIVESLSGLSHLESIDIHGRYALNDEDLLEIAVNFPCLKIVSLHACWGLTANAVSQFIQLLPCLHTLKLKVNSNLVLNDMRSELSMREGLHTVREISASPWAHTVTLLCLHFVPIETSELTLIIRRLTSLRKLSISNCEVRWLSLVQI